MTFEREAHVGRRHSTAVIDDIDQIDPARGERHRDPGRPRVDRVFDEFLQRAGGSFDYFTGGDTLDKMLGQATYLHAICPTQSASAPRPPTTQTPPAASH